MNEKKETEPLPIHSLEAKKNPLIACVKKVKEDKIEEKDIYDFSDIQKIVEIVNDKLPKPEIKKLSEIGLRTNPRKWIKKLINEYPNISLNNFEELLIDFTDGMQTRMREDSKYVIGILYKNSLLIAHTAYGEETITLGWKVIPRMLDRDNILRYVHFLKHNDEILVKFYETVRTDSFVEWLRLPQKDAFYYFGGKYRIETELDGIPIFFELTEKDMEKWLSNHPELRDGMLELEKPVSMFNIKQILVARKKYISAADFVQDYVAEKFNINYYRNEFRNILNSLSPLLTKYIDDETRVFTVLGDETETVVYKENHNLQILFSTGKPFEIEIRESYLHKLYREFINGEVVNIYHCGDVFTQKPMEISHLRIFNEIKTSVLTTELIKYYNETNLQDSFLIKIISNIIFESLSRDNEELHISYFFKRLSERIRKDIAKQKRLTKLEDKILEFKSNEFFVGNTEEIAQKLSKDIKKKVGQSENKVYVIGVEDNGEVTGISKSRLKSDRLESIRKKIEELTAYKIHLFLIIWDNIGIVVLIVEGEHESKK